MAASPHGWPLRVPGGDHHHAGGQRGHRLVEQLAPGFTPIPPACTVPSPPTTAWRPSSAGSSSGKSVRWWAPRLSSRARHGGRHQPGDREGVAARARAARPRTGAGRRGATARRAWPARAGEGSGASPASPGVGRARLVPRGGRGASRRARSTPRASSTPAGSPRAGPCRRIRPRRRARAPRRGRRGRWPRRPSCSAPPARRGSCRVAGSMPSSASASPMLGKRAMSDRRACRAPRSARRSRAASPRSPAPPRRAGPARPRTARRSASSRVAPSPRTASVMRKPSRGPSLTSAVGWNCVNSRSARSAPAACASARPTPTAPGGFVVRAHSAAEPAGGEHRAAGGDRERRRPRPSALTPVQRPSRTVSAEAVVLLEHVDALVGGRERGELARDPAAGGGAAGVHDAALGVAALEAEREAAAAVAVEAHAQRLQLAHPAGRVLAQHRARRSAAPRRGPRPACPGRGARASRPPTSAAAMPPWAQ